MTGKGLVTSPSEDEFTVDVSQKFSPQWDKFVKRVSGRVFGQDRAIRKAVRRIMIASSGFQNLERPPSPLLFAGPPGSGKTYLAEVLAQEWLGAETGNQSLNPLVKISGENYTQSHEGATLKGSPPGYVGYEDESPLEKIGMFDLSVREEEFDDILDEWRARSLKKEEFGELPKEVQDKLRHTWQRYKVFYIREFSPFRSVLLVDEFEKMHSIVQKQFLGILDKGRLQLHSGRVIDFRGCLIIFTSNIGTEKITNILEGNAIGFAPPRGNQERTTVDQEIYEMVKAEVKQKLDPAIYSRIGSDGIVVFHALSREEYRRIIEKEVLKIKDGFAGRNEKQGALLISTSEGFVEFILEEADARREGARQIGRLLDKYLKEPLVVAVNSGEIKNGDTVLFDVVTEGAGKRVKLKRLPRPGGMALKNIPRQAQGIDNAMKKDILRDLDSYWKRTKLRLQLSKLKDKPPSV